MSKSKIILFAVSGFVAVLIFGAVALLLFVDANAYKPRLEATASEALGMEVRVGGRMGIRFFPDLRVTLEDLHIRNRGADVASAKEATLGIDLLPLIQSEVGIRKIVLNHLRISIERGRDGRLNFETPEAAKRTLPTLALERVFVLDGSLVYVDSQTGEGFEATDCNLDLPRLRLTSREGPDFLKNLSFNAELACGEIATANFAASDLKFSAQAGTFLARLLPSFGPRIDLDQRLVSLSQNNHSSAAKDYRPVFLLWRFGPRVISGGSSRTRDRCGRRNYGCTGRL